MSSKHTQVDYERVLLHRCSGLQRICDVSHKETRKHGNEAKSSEKNASGRFGKGSLRSRPRGGNWISRCYEASSRSGPPSWCSQWSWSPTDSCRCKEQVLSLPPQAGQKNEKSMRFVRQTSLQGPCSARQSHVHAVCELIDVLFLFYKIYVLYNSLITWRSSHVRSVIIEKP